MTHIRYRRAATGLIALALLSGPGIATAASESNIADIIDMHVQSLGQGLCDLRRHHRSS